MLLNRSLSSGLPTWAVKYDAFLADAAKDWYKKIHKHLYDRKIDRASLKYQQAYTRELKDRLPGNIDDVLAGRELQELARLTAEAALIHTPPLNEAMHFWAEVDGDHAPPKVLGHRLSVLVRFHETFLRASYDENWTVREFMKRQEKQARRQFRNVLADDMEFLAAMTLWRESIRINLLGPRLEELKPDVPESLEELTQRFLRAYADVSGAG